MGSLDAVTSLLRMLTTDESSYVRGRAASALRNIGDKTAIPPLKKALKDEGDYSGEKVKGIAFEALEKISRRLGMRILKE